MLIVISVLCGSCTNKDYLINLESVKQKIVEILTSENDSVEINRHSTVVEKIYSTKALASKIMDEKRIYLIDLTRSMRGFNGEKDIFDSVKHELGAAISEITDTTTEIVLIPFTDRPLDIYTNTIRNKENILKYISNLDTRHGDTNILEAWNKGVEQLDSTCINYMFMLTDGVHNCGVPIEDLYRTLNEWHIKSVGKYEFAFYVLLSPAAKEQEICRIVENSRQMWLVPSMDIHTTFIIGKMNVDVNIKDKDTVMIHLTCTNPEIFNDGFKFHLSIPENKYYRIKNASDVIDHDGNVTFEIEKLKAQKELPVMYQTKIHMDYDREKFPLVFMTPEEYNFNIVNVGTRIMTIKRIKK